LAISGGSAQPRTDCAQLVSQSTKHLPNTRLTSATDIPIWKTITLGECPDVNSVRAAMDNSPCLIGVGGSVDEAIGRPTFHFTKTKVDLDLVVLSVADLGFPADGETLEAIYSRAISIGLELCPPNLGPVLRLNYLNQPRGEFLHDRRRSRWMSSHSAIGRTGA
jgi:hypothetical protein